MNCPSCAVLVIICGQSSWPKMIAHMSLLYGHEILGQSDPYFKIAASIRAMHKKLGHSDLFPLIYGHLFSFPHIGRLSSNMYLNPSINAHLREM